jgi:hypothetical protein
MNEVLYEDLKEFEKAIERMRYEEVWKFLEAVRNHATALHITTGMYSNNQNNSETGVSTKTLEL